MTNKSINKHKYKDNKIKYLLSFIQFLEQQLTNTQNPNQSDAWAEGDSKPARRSLQLFFEM